MTSSNDRNDSQVRRIVADLRDDAPVRPAWDDIERRSAQYDADVVDLADHRRRRLLAAAASVAIVGAGATALVVTGGRDTESPAAEEPLDASTLPVAAPTTALVVPGTTDPIAAPTTIASPGPVDSIEPTTIPPSTTTPTTTTTILTAATTTIPRLDLEPSPLSTARSIPLGSWIASLDAPAGLTEVYTIDQPPRRTVAYSDGRALVTVVSEPLGFPGGEPVQIDGLTWLRTADPERESIDYTVSIGDTQVTVIGDRLDDTVLAAFVATLVVGDDGVVGTTRLATFWEAGMDAVAANESAALSVSGNAGWYCISFSAYDLGATLECGVGRAGDLASPTWELAGEAGRHAAGIVSPEVAAIEVAFGDGTSRRADATGISTRYDDRFYVIDVSPVVPPGPTGDPAPPYELRLLAADGSVLGVAPAVER